MMMPSLFTENLFDDFFNDFDEDFFGKKNPLYGKHARNMMKTDVRETDTTYEVDIDLPGFKKEDINVNYENGYLTISTSKGLDKNEKDEEYSCLHNGCMVVCRLRQSGDFPGKGG